jgi:hypothetical protein
VPPSDGDRQRENEMRTLHASDEKKYEQKTVEAKKERKRKEEKSPTTSIAWLFSPSVKESLDYIMSLGRKRWTHLPSPTHSLLCLSGHSVLGPQFICNPGREEQLLYFSTRVAIS